jgi:hypothetical protein
MKQIIEKTFSQKIYICPYCKTEHKTKEKCKSCLKQCDIHNMEKKAWKIFNKIQHPETNKFTTYCAFCHKLLVKRQCVEGDHEYIAGKTIYESGDAVWLYGIHTCRKCRIKHKIEIYNKLDKIGYFKYFKRTNTSPMYYCMKRNI